MKRQDIKRRPMADRTLHTLEAESREYREFDSEGLYFRVRPNGKKSWQLRYKDPITGKWTWHSLGSYGHGPSLLTGEHARKRARDLLTRVANGESLRETRAECSAASETPKELTLGYLAEEWLVTQRPRWTTGTAVRNTGALQKHILPVFGERDLAGITSMEWMERFRQMEATGIIEQTGRVRALCRSIYDLALITGRAQTNPIESLHRFLQVHHAQNFAHVPESELPTLVRVIRAYPHAPDVRIGLQLLMLLTCRPSELREASWSEFDIKTGVWEIPAARMKMRRPHVVPLPTQAQRLLKELHYITGSFPILFPGRGNAKKPRSNTVFIMALRRLGYEGKQTPHGFRHIASTLLNEHGFSPDHIEAQLAHVKGGVRGVYDKSVYLQQRSEMMQWYADHLDALTEKTQKSANYVKE